LFNHRSASADQLSLLNFKLGTDDEIPVCPLLSTSVIKPDAWAGVSHIRCEGRLVHQIVALRCSAFQQSAGHPGVIVPQACRAWTDCTSVRIAKTKIR
jgi:hypothetical protein